jgi:PTS system nitrogen regulatory IIA component
MALADLIAQNSVLPALKANSKKQLLQELAAKASEVTGLAEREVFDVILQRERLGSTGVGNGIAIPHGKLASLDKIVGVFARLDQPVDFEALDDQPVDLVFLLLAPEGAGADHLKALSRIARVMRDSDMVAKLRATDNAASLHAFLTEEPESTPPERACVPKHAGRASTSFQIDHSEKPGNPMDFGLRSLRIQGVADCLGAIPAGDDRR